MKLKTVLLLSAVFLFSTGWSVRDLGTLPGSSGSFATAINNHGNVVGHAQLTTGGMRAVYWPPTGIVELPTPPVGPWFIGSTARDISDKNVVVGSMENAPSLGDAYIWYAGAPSVVNLGMGSAYAVNMKVEVAGHTPDGYDYPGALWLDQGISPPTYLGSLGTARWSPATDMDPTDLPVIVGSSQVDPDRHDHAYLWVSGAMTDLGTLGGRRSHAYGVRVVSFPDEIDVVGQSEISPDSSEYHAFHYKGGTMNHLPPLPGWTNARAEAINSSGDIVGFSSNEDGSKQHATIWRGGVPHDLNDFISPLEGWVLAFASDINDVGQIVGTGTHHGATRAFVLTP